MNLANNENNSQLDFQLVEVDRLISNKSTYKSGTNYAYVWEDGAFFLNCEHLKGKNIDYRTAMNISNGNVNYIACEQVVYDQNGNENFVKYHKDGEQEFQVLHDTNGKKISVLSEDASELINQAKQLVINDAKAFDRASFPEGAVVPKISEIVEEFCDVQGLQLFSEEFVQ